MRSWSELHKILAATSKAMRDEFKADISEKTLASVVEELIQARLNDRIYTSFQTLSTPDLLVALEILTTDKKALEKAQAERSTKSKKELN